MRLHGNDRNFPFPCTLPPMVPSMSPFTGREGGGGKERKRQDRQWSREVKSGTQAGRRKRGKKTPTICLRQDKQTNQPNKQTNNQTNKHETSQPANQPTIQTSNQASTQAGKQQTANQARKQANKVQGKQGTWKIDQKGSLHI